MQTDESENKNLEEPIEANEETLEFIANLIKEKTTLPAHIINELFL